MFLGIDYGQKRIGLAMGSQFPRGIGTLNNPGSFDIIVDKIYVICMDYDIEKIIVGHPTKLSGEPGELTEEIRFFVKRLKQKTGIPVVLEEEAYTSVEAEEELRRRGLSPQEDKDKIDELAAILILEQYLEKKEREERISKNF